MGTNGRCQCDVSALRAAVRWYRARMDVLERKLAEQALS
jgi:hypothetical protein